MQIVKYPHPTLRHKSRPLRRVDRELKRMVGEMFDLMYQEQGIGLSANQVDLPYRLFILNVSADPLLKDEERVFVNPVITRSRGMVEDREGCLSFPDIFVPVRRPEKIVVQAYDLSGREVTLQLDGLYARAAHHEADHLDGVLFIDRLSPTAELAVRGELAALEREFQRERQRGYIPDNDQIAARLAELEGVRT